MMLVEQPVDAVTALFVADTFGLGATKPRAIGLRLLCRLLALVALLEALQVDNVPHARPRHSATRKSDRVSQQQEQSRCAPAGSIVIQNPRSMLFDNTKK